MDQGVESRLLVAELIAKCMDVGVSRQELMRIVTGGPGDVSTLLDDVFKSDCLERRVRYLLEIIRIAKAICGAETGPWLRSENPALGQRAPLDTLLDFPDALPGMMHLMRRLGECGDSIH